MGALVSLATSIVPYLCDCLALRYNRLRGLPHNIRALRSEMDELNCIKSDLERRVEEQERALKKPLSQVIHWLQKADDLEKQVNNLARKRCLNGCCPDFLSDYNLGKEVLRLTNEVVEHKGKGSFDVVAETPLPDRGEVFDNVNIVGDEQTLNDIRDCIQKEDVKIIGIYGMGGVGKTTLSKKINNEFVQMSQAFDVVIWAVVSHPVNVKNIQTEIAKRLGLPFSADEDQETRANKLLKGLRTRKFLLLLDDLWKPLDLRGIGVPTTTTQKESKIVFTTRSLSVCSDMDAHEKIQVKGLPEEEAWALFQNKVGKVVKDPSIFTLAKDVAKKCDGLPLALVTVAHATANRTTPEEWEDALTVLNKSASELQGMKDKVFYLLKFSYDSLESENIKSCFLYCSLFPEDFDIKTEDLIEYWIAEGLIGRVDSVDEAYNRGFSLIGRLISSCMLERSPIKNHVKMHDVIREMAIWVAIESGKWMVKARMELTRAPDEASTWGEAERISLMGNKIEEILPTQPPECPKLSTLFLQENYNLNVISERFFEHMPSLRVLDMRNTGISKLPPSLFLLENLRALFIDGSPIEAQLRECSKGGLKHLQVLNLAFCDIMELPNNLCELTNLFKLELSSNFITKLPEGIGKLTKLRHLGLQNQCGGALLLIPYGVISKLSCLKTLELYGTHLKWIREGHLDGDDGSGRMMIHELEQLRNLTRLTITIFDNHRTLHFFLQSTFLLKCTTELEIRKCNEGFTQMPQPALAKMKNLESLEIKECNELETLIIGEELEESSLSRLYFLYLDHLPKLVRIVEGVVQRGCLEALSRIEIECCKRLRNIEGLQQLQNLDNLTITGGGEMEVMIGNEAVLANAFPRLRNFEILSFPRLRSICDQVLRLPSLQLLFVSNCPNLKRIPLDSRHTKIIQFIRGKREWWEGLEWEDDNTKQALQPHFVDD